MAILINTPTSPYSSYSVTLLGSTYQLTQRWNDRSQSWYLDVATSEGVTIRTGAKLLPKVPLIMSNKHLFPDGNLHVVRRVDGYTTDVNRENLGIDEPYSLAFIEG